jgi:hypothetical protein
VTLTKEQRDALEDAIAHFENAGCCSGGLDRDVLLEDCEDCCAGPGQPCEDDCNRMATARHRDTIREMLE